MDWFILLMCAIACGAYVLIPIVIIILLPFAIYDLITEMINSWHFYKLRRKARQRK